MQLFIVACMSVFVRVVSRSNIQHWIFGVLVVMHTRVKPDVWINGEWELSEKLGIKSRGPGFSCQCSDHWATTTRQSPTLTITYKRCAGGVECFSQAPDSRKVCTIYIRDYSLHNIEPILFPAEERWLNHLIPNVNFCWRHTAQCAEKIVSARLCAGSA